MRILELFAGTGIISDTFRRRGHIAYTVDWDPDTRPDMTADVSKLTAADVIELCHGVPDVVWASPDCTTYSVAALGTHRKKVGDTLEPRTDYARQCDMTNAHMVDLIEQLLSINPRMIYFIENPRGGVRKMPFVQGLPRYTVTYCQYGESRMKPTDIWTNHPDPQFKPACKNGDTCHVRAPRGSRSGTQAIKGKLERARIPTQLCEHIVDICEWSNEQDNQGR